MYAVISSLNPFDLILCMHITITSCQVVISKAKKKQSKKGIQNLIKKARSQDKSTCAVARPPIALCRLDYQRCRHQAPVSATTVPSPYPRPACASPRSTASPVVRNSYRLPSTCKLRSRCGCAAGDFFTCIAAARRRSIAQRRRGPQELFK
jgi:hypothetical protein